MKKKELLKEVGKIHKSKEPVSVGLVDTYGKEFYTRICKLNFIHSLIYVIFLLGSILMYPKINHLSFISEDFYIKLITIILAITLVIAVIFFTLYIYSNKKEKLISLKQLKNSYGYVFRIFK